MTECEREYRDNSGDRTHGELLRWQIDEIETAVKEADAGLFATDKQVRQRFVKWTA